MTNFESRNEERADLLTEDLLWGSPRTSDGAFLAAVRSRIDVQVADVWMSFRSVLAITGTTAVLMIGVLLPGQESGQRLNEEVAATTLTNTVDEFVVVDADPLELADYLGVESETMIDENSVVEEADETTSITDVTTDEMLELDEQELEFVIAEIQETVFF